MHRWGMVVLVALGPFALASGGCTGRRAETPLSDAGLASSDAAARDAWRGDAPPSSFDCDPIDTGVFVMGNFFEEDGSLARRALGSYDPGPSRFTELADVGSCIEGWYVRAMTVSRDGIVLFLLANQTLAAYTLETGACEVHPLLRSADDGLYGAITFLGDGSGSTSTADEELVVAFRSYSDADPIVLLTLDRTTFAETPRAEIDAEGSVLISLTGTEDGRLFATRGNVASDADQHDIVLIDAAAGTTDVVATTPLRHEVWFRTAVALWDSRVLVFDAIGAPDPVTTISEANLRDGSWSEPLTTLERFELEAVSTTTCVGVLLI